MVNWVGWALTGWELWEHLGPEGQDQVKSTVGQVLSRNGGGSMTTGAIVGTGGVQIGNAPLGTPEPVSGVAKQWEVQAISRQLGQNWTIFYYQMMDGRMLMYNPRKRQWKTWRPKKSITISHNPRIGTIRKAERAIVRAEKRLAKASDNLAYVGTKKKVVAPGMVTRKGK